MTIKCYRDLIVWQKAMDLVEEVYQLTMAFPREEIYGLTSQMRRAAVSVPSNIAEGHGHTTDKNFRYFLNVSQGSLRELETQLMVACRLGYLASEEVEPVLGLCDEIGKMLTGLQKRLGARS